jgi:hypothetical protein
MAVMFSALSVVGCPLSPGRFVVLFSGRGRVDPRAVVLLEGLRQLRNAVTSSGMEHATFRLLLKLERSILSEFVFVMSSVTIAKCVSWLRVVVTT